MENELNHLLLVGKKYKFQIKNLLKLTERNFIKVKVQTATVI